MKFHPLEIDGAYLIEFTPHGDDRGSFTRVFCADTISQNTGFKSPLKNVNHSITTSKGSIRGLRYQIAPALEAKIIRCLKGSAYDVFVDLRQDSKTFMQVVTNEFSGDDNKAVFIPEGCAHGFQTLSNNTEIMYMTSVNYNKECERTVNYSDPLLNINFPLEVSDISEHDKNIPFLDKDFKGIKI